MPSTQLPGAATGAESAHRVPLADVLGRVQALHARRLPGRLPDRVAVPHRVRHRRRAGRHLQRLRLLRAGLPVRRHRPAHRRAGHEERRHRAEVHALLRPARRRARRRPARRPARPSRSSSATWTSCASARRPGSRRCTSNGVPEARLYGENPDDGIGGGRRDVPAARRARGLRPAAGPGRDAPATCPRCGAAPASPRPLTLARRRGRRRSSAAGGRMTAAPERQRRRRRARRGGDGAPVVPDVEFTSYYGRPVVKASPWESDIPAYLFLGGLAAGSSLLAAGADLTGRPALRRAGRLGALVAHHAQLRRAGARPRAAGAVRQHAAGGQADLADVGRHLDPDRSTGRRPGSPARPSCATGAAAARRAGAGCSGSWRRPAGLGAAVVRAGGRGLHRGAAGRHRDAGLARGLPRAAVRLRRLGRGGRRRPRPDRRAAGRGRAGAAAGRARRGGRAGGRASAWSARWGWPPRRCTRAWPGSCMRASKALTAAGALGRARRAAQPDRSSAAAGVGAAGRLGRAPGSRSSRPARPRPATRSTPSSRSANGSSASGRPISGGPVHRDDRAARRRTRR